MALKHTKIELDNKYLTDTFVYGIKAIFAQPSMTGLALWQFETTGAKSIVLSTVAADELPRIRCRRVIVHCN